MGARLIGKVISATIHKQVFIELCADLYDYCRAADDMESTKALSKLVADSSNALDMYIQRSDKA